MKNFKFLPFLCLLLFPIILISCSDDDTEEPENDFYTLNISVNDGNIYDMDSVLVKLTYENDTVIIARSSYNKGNIQLKLPKTIDEKYLQNATEVFNTYMEDTYNENEDLIQVSDKSAKILNYRLRIDAYKNGGIKGNVTPSSRFTYVNKSFIVSGEYEDMRTMEGGIKMICDLSFKQGWDCYKRSRLTDDFYIGYSFYSIDLNSLEWELILMDM